MQLLSANQLSALCRHGVFRHSVCHLAQVQREKTKALNAGKCAQALPRNSPRRNEICQNSETTQTWGPETGRWAPCSIFCQIIILHTPFLRCLWCFYSHLHSRREEMRKKKKKRKIVDAAPSCFLSPLITGWEKPFWIRDPLLFPFCASWQNDKANLLICSSDSL